MEPATITCPLEASIRAARCGACCDANAVPPCVESWLRARTSSAPVMVLHAERPNRRAA